MSTATYNDSSLETLEQYISKQREPVWLTDVRIAALKKFQTLEWPSRQDEEFRRTDVSSYGFESWAFESVPGPVAEVENPVGISGTLTLDGTRTLRRSLAAGLADKGVILASFEEVAAGALPDTVARQVASTLMKSVDNADNKLSLWHYVTMTHGAVLYVPEFLELSDPFVITFDDGADKVLRSPQVVVTGDRGARFSVLHRTRSGEEGELLLNEGIDIDVGDSGKVEYFLMQTINLDSTAISNGLGTVGRDATLHMYSAVFGGLLSKYRFDAEMIGEGGDAYLGGVYFPHEDQHIDLRTEQRHLGKKAHSLTLYKGAVICEAHSVYQGLIRVDHDALNTDAYLTNNNLLLGTEAQADSIPTLQINTDEVRCSHGSTTGKLDKRHIYYLESRGYSPEEARHLLIQGFFEEVLTHYPEIAQDELHQIVEARICECE
ncbi:MAG: SufD family Fe-S cluster assembly protein [Spirochaetaceae bacterium]|nr:MAG: SufD family Fe-S cluster assembly protein [Spirochaetaceae bacterium]